MTEVQNVFQNKCLVALYAVGIIINKAYTKGNKGCQ
jgi:hypothetical protein